jgi:UTP--glucose-1-phosphate uridylyltransferase
MAELIGSQPFHGLTFDGARHDCGDAKGYVIANLSLGLARDDLAPATRALMAGMGGG